MHLCAAASVMIGKVSAHQLTAQDWYRLGFTMTEQQRKQGIRAFGAFLTRAWFKRVWIIQEFAVPGSVTFLCGQYEFQEQQIFSAFDFLTITEAACTSVSSDSEGGAGSLEYLRSIRADWKAGQRLPLLMLLRDHQPFHCSEWKDKIYALMQLASDVGPRPTDLNILVNYEKDKYIENGETIEVEVVPLGTVYRSVAIEMLQKHRLLDVVSCAGIHDIWLTERLKPWEKKAYHERLPGLPSWVPDWHRPDNTPHPQRFERHFHANVGPVNTTQFSMTPYKFQASGTSIFSYREPMDANKLIVRAMLLQTITLVGDANHQPLSSPPESERLGQPTWMVEPSPSEMMRQIELSCAIFENWAGVVGAQSNQVYFTGESMLDVLWQTMMGGVFPSGIDTDRMLFMQWYQMTRTTSTITLGLRESPALRMFAAGAYALYKKATQAPKQISNFMFRTYAMTANKAIFRTTGNANSLGYVGLAPRGTMQGDVIAILEGGKVPFVLRQNGIFWQVIGACYVHGVMFGQIFDPGRCVDIVLV
ncbi:hypothetical protein BKA63DRAFT_522272 [Paraphoma chrysanthemicola]|nr:hypothetical protein BKA63DRAFT_522272 [Paraphoma chrysanthemicola]